MGGYCGVEGAGAAGKTIEVINPAGIGRREWELPDAPAQDAMKGSEQDDLLNPSTRCRRRREDRQGTSERGSRTHCGVGDVDGEGCI